jgi:CRP/FNR family cyclic AMP-dependent transcriptional regulator
MIGTTRSRVSFFMNRFRKLGFISYNGRIQVHKSLLNVVLLDQLQEHNSEKPPIVSSVHVLSDRPIRGSSNPADPANLISRRWESYRAQEPA